MGADAQIGFRVVPWDAQAVAELHRIADASDHFASWQKAWDEGRAQLWGMFDGQTRLGCVLWEVVGSDIHVLAASGQDRHQRGTGALLDVFAALSRMVGAAGVYCDTHRPGLVRRLTRLGCAAWGLGPDKWRVAYVQ